MPDGDDLGLWHCPVVDSLAFFNCYSTTKNRLDRAHNMKAQNSTILLAGGGDLSRRAGRILLAQGHEVWALRRHPPGDDAAGLQWLAADLTDAATLLRLPRSISHVLYAVAPGQRSPQAYRSAFLDGCANLLAALDHEVLRRFVFVSSSAVYGASEHWVDEDTPARPQGYNGEILLEAENRLRQSLGHKAVALRLSGLYGTGTTQLLNRLRQNSEERLVGKEWISTGRTQ